MSARSSFCLASVVLAASIVAGGSTLAKDASPPQQIVRKDVLTAVIEGRKDVARVEIKEIDFAPSQRTGLHRHPCPVVGYVAAGAVRVQVEGQAPRVVTAGEAFFEPAHTTIRQFDNVSPREPAKFVAFYLLGTDEHQLIEMLE
jgi:quercetin dioxygenase-like cupin family protein